MVRPSSLLRAQRALFGFTVSIVVWATVGMTPTILHGEPLRIAYTSIAFVYGPLWLTKEAALFKKYNIDAEFIYIAGGPPSLQALIAGDVAISFTAAGAAPGAKLSKPKARVRRGGGNSFSVERFAIASIQKPQQLKRASVSATATET